MNSKNLDNFLSKEEKNTLKLVNEKSNNFKNKIQHNKNILNKTLNDIIKEWSLKHQKMLDETLILIKEINSMKKYKEYNNWWRYITKYLNDFFIIITKEDRMIYSGITIILISFLLFIINSAS